MLLKGFRARQDEAGNLRFMIHFFGLIFNLYRYCIVFVVFNLSPVSYLCNYFLCSNYLLFYYCVLSSDGQSIHFYSLCATHPRTNHFIKKVKKKQDQRMHSPNFACTNPLYFFESFKIEKNSISLGLFSFHTYC